MSRITDYLEGLRAKADWLEEHETEIAGLADWMTTVTSIPVDDRDELRDWLGIFGRVDRVEFDDEKEPTTVSFVLDFGGGVEIEVFGSVEALCERVEETAEVTVTRWVAPPLLTVVP